MLETNRPIVRRWPLGDDYEAIEVRDCYRLVPMSHRWRTTLRMRENDLAHVPRAADFVLDIPINTFAVDGEFRSTRLGPDEWLLDGPEGEADRLGSAVAAAFGEIPHALVDISHRHTALQLEGSKAADMLNAGCPLDLAAQAFPTGTATRSLLGKVEIILWRLSDAPVYGLECGRSFAPYVWEFLVEAGREYR